MLIKRLNVFAGILVIFLVFSLLSVGVQAAKSVNVGIKTNEDPFYKSFSDKVNFGWSGGLNGGYNLSWAGGYVIIQPKIRYNTVDYTAQDIKDIFPNVEFSNYIVKQRSWKYALNISNIPSQLINNIDAIVYEVIDWSGITGDDVRKEGSYIIVKDKYALSFSDLFEGFTIESISKTKLVLGNVQSNIIDGVLYLDPYVQPYPFHDGYLERRVTGVFEVYLSDNILRVGNNVGGGDADYIYRTYLKINTSEIDPWDDIINATLYARISAESCGSGDSDFWVQNITDYGDLGESDWDTTPVQNITILYYAPENGTGWHSANITGFINKGGITYYRLQGSYEDYSGVDCHIQINSNETANEPYLEIWYNEGTLPAEALNITIHSPQNTTYPFASPIDLNVTANGTADTWWYSLNGGSNTTFIPNSTIIPEKGYNTLQVWVNSTGGVESDAIVGFTVSAYATALNCWADPDMVHAGSSLNRYCNYTYLNGTPIDSDAVCQVKLNTSVRMQRYADGMDEFEFVYGDMFAGFDIDLLTIISNVSGGAYVKCTNDTLHGLDVYMLVSDVNPYENLNGTHNITSHNYTVLLYQNVTCDYLDSLFGIKGSFGEIELSGNDTLSSQFIAQLGNPSTAHRGFFYGCPDCTGVGGDEWYIGVDDDNEGHTFHGNLSQTSNWATWGHEHMQWLSFKTGWVNMTYDALSGLYYYNINTSVWAVTGQRQSLFQCSKLEHENQTDEAYYNVIGATLLTCSIDSYISEVILGHNQTFTWSANSLTPFIHRYARIVKNGDVFFSTTDTGTFSHLMNESGTYTLECYVSNIMGSYNDSEVFVVGEAEFTLGAYYPPFAEVGQNVIIYGFLFNETGDIIHPIPNLIINIDGSSANMVWVSADNAYEVIWIPSVNGDYPFNITAPVNMLVYDGEIKVRTPFNITISLWNNINMSAGSEYLNEFAWIYAVYSMDDPTLKMIFERDTKLSCPPQGADICYWHGKYTGGNATLELFLEGNYTFYIIGNNILFEQNMGNGIVTDCDFCEPVEIQKRLLLPLGNYYLDEAENIDIYVSENELYYRGLFYGVMGSWLYAGIMFILAVVAFVGVLWATQSLKSAIAALVLLPTLIWMIVTFTL